MVKASRNENRVYKFDIGRVNDIFKRGNSMEKEKIIKTTQELIRIRTENPPGNEEACADYVEQFFKNAGIKTLRMKVEEKRPNIIAKLKGNFNKPLVFLAHMDTVEVGEDWNVGPFSGEIREGKLYGRGAADMKGGLAVGMNVIAEISKMNLQLKRDLLFFAYVDEEEPSAKGIDALIKEGMIPENAFILILEPTNLKLAIAAKGVGWYEVIVKGKSAHAATPWEGANSIMAMSLMLVKLKDRVDRLKYDHPLLGRPQFTVGKIIGGLKGKVNMVPSSCKAEIDLRFVPPLSCDDVTEMIDICIKEACKTIPGTSGSMRNLSFPKPPFFSEADSILVKSIEMSYQEVTGKHLEKFGMLGYTDASVVGAKQNNKNCYVFGPGNIAQGHAVDEFVPIDEIYDCYQILLSAAVDLLTRGDD